MLDNLEQAALNHPTQVATTTVTIGAANADKVQWFDPYWTPIWNFLPWSQMATIIGLCWIGYSFYMTQKNKNK